MQPNLREPEYVFCTVPAASYGDYQQYQPLASFAEEEGLTLVLERPQALSAGFDCSASFKAISLSVHSSLEAVGLTAAVSTVLAEQGISANVIAAFYHDHLFVPAADAQRALDCLTQLQQAHSAI